MLRKLVCAVAILGLSIGLALAEEITGRITKIDGNKVTVVTGKKGETKTAEYELAKDCKVCKMDKKAKVELADGVKNEAFKEIDPKKGIPARLNITDGKVTEIVLVGGKKKTDN
ncbi:MAG: hypothetical protein NZO58_07600 [Gemmataceae bacterium]|nr:hypothetical protein [Gemmataceae bacterium]